MILYYRTEDSVHNFCTTKILERNIVLRLTLYLADNVHSLLIRRFSEKVIGKEIPHLLVIKIPLAAPLDRMQLDCRNL